MVTICVERPPPKEVANLVNGRELQGVLSTLRWFLALQRLPYPSDGHGENVQLILRHAINVYNF